MKSTKAFRAVTTVDTAYCPHCEAENDNIHKVVKNGECTEIQQSTIFDVINHEPPKDFICECWNCKKTFKVDYFEEV